MSMLHPVIIALAPYVLALIGIGLLLYERKNIYWGFQSYSWPRVLGRLVARTEDPIEIMASVGTHGLARKRGSLPIYWYEFKVGQRTYRGNRYSFGSIFDTLIPKYLSEDYVGVYYDPANPENAVLNRGVPVGSLVGLIPLVCAGCLWVTHL